jgi:deoxyribodipyrimidine photo-lyase
MGAAHLSGASALVVFTRDLRVHDHPALSSACRAGGRVTTLFVLDDRILRSGFHRPNRARFLTDSVRDLDRSLVERGGRLVLRRGEWVEEVIGAAHDVRATDIHLSDDVSAHAQARIAALERATDDIGVAVHRHPGITVVPPGSLRPPEGDHYRVFTPYYRRWLEVRWRRPAPLPDRIDGTNDPRSLPLGVLDELVGSPLSPDLIAGGEQEGRRRLNRWVRSGLAGYEADHDDLAGDATSRISAFVHFGCVSPLEIASKLRDRPGGDAYVRQLCWRDFYHQVLAARPDAAWSDYRSRDDRWHRDADALDAWITGRTGFPVVDAAMRQLQREGFMHNRARMVVASFLTKDLYVDWRLGARHFLDWLVDGDVANNNLNWQWTAGTGTDTNPHRVFNPTRQGERFDPRGDYIRRYVDELASVEGRAIHDPDATTRRACGYPAPIVDHREAIAQYRARLSPGRGARDGYPGSP